MLEPAGATWWSGQRLREPDRKVLRQPGSRNERCASSSSRSSSRSFWFSRSSLSSRSSGSRCGLAGTSWSFCECDFGFEKLYWECHRQVTRAMMALTSHQSDPAGVRSCRSTLECSSSDINLVCLDDLCQCRPDMMILSHSNISVDSNICYFY